MSSMMNEIDVQYLLFHLSYRIFFISTIWSHPYHFYLTSIKTIPMFVQNDMGHLSTSAGLWMQPSAMVDESKT